MWHLRHIYREGQDRLLGRPHRGGGGGGGTLLAVVVAHHFRYNLGITRHLEVTPYDIPSLTTSRRWRRLRPFDIPRHPEGGCNLPARVDISLVRL